MSFGVLQIQSGTQAGSQRLFDQEHSSGTCLNCRIDDASLLNFRNAAGNADDNTGLRRKHGSLGCGLEHLLKHSHRHFVIGNDAVPQRPHGNHVAGGTVQHIPGRGANLKNLAGIPVQGNNAGLANHKAFAVCINQNIGGTQVNTQVIGKQLHLNHPLVIFFGNAPPQWQRSELLRLRLTGELWRILPLWLRW